MIGMRVSSSCFAPRSDEPKRERRRCSKRIEMGSAEVMVIERKVVEKSGLVEAISWG